MLTKDLTTKTMSFAKGANYVGETWYGKKHGEGTYTYANGNKYAGQFKDGPMHGEGTFTFANGAKYVGQWKDNKKHGLGKYTFASGEVHHDGEWENDQTKIILWDDQLN